jgi:protein-arginine kinase activator protein McsA
MVRVASYSVGTLLTSKSSQQSEELKEFKRLFKELQRAIVSEEYMEAAKIRDELYQLRERL